MTLSQLVRLLPAAAFALGAFARPFTPEDLVQTNRFSGGVAVSPSSAAIAYVQARYSMEDKRQYTQLFVQSLTGGHPSHGRGSLVKVVDFSADARPNPPSDSKGTTANEDVAVAGGHGRNDIKPSQPVWLTDSLLGFVATDSGTGKSTLYSVKSAKGRWSKPRAVVTLAVPISDLHYSAESNMLAFTAEVYNGTDSLEETAKLDRQERLRADTGQTYDDLWVRHWDTFTSPKLPQIYTLPLKAVAKDHFRPAGGAVNIISATSADGRLEASNSFTFSPTGRHIAFVAKQPGRDYAWKTTSHVYLASVNGSAAEPINPGQGGASSSPSFSHDGTKIAYVQMASSTYEADRNQIKIYDIDQQTTVEVAADWDRSPSHILWADGNTLLATYNEWGRNKLAKVNIATGEVTPVVSEHSVGSVQRLPGTEKLLIDYSALDSPNDLFTVSIADGAISRVSQLNPHLAGQIFLSQPEDVQFAGADNSTIHGFLLCPPNFDSQKKYPLAFVIHGGPQSSFTDGWSSRWNLNIFAAAGFVTVALDPQGSTGYGQNFTDAIRNQWGGKPFESLMLSLDQLLDEHPYIDRDRLAALGASYGGYMVNWINGHTGVFKALVNHDGMFSTVSTYYSTEELYFPETEFGGVPYDDKARDNYERWSPERFVRNWKTPTLVVHSEKDYRLVASEGLSTFTALRRQGVPARLLYFPDENHWVLKPANSLRWHQEVLNWISQWTLDEPVKPAGLTRFRVQLDNN
ncbi:dipeptidylpeptidase [Coemansia thaxteri]|uniref:Dipeptidyl-peptidase V n=1 Tax=Coemansia thaxteri TaxID=2663907 RepID=A0A9W8EJ00_9FUNG|nr:dipeptidylpeptidase [Coemansia thaxteri]KAJ2480346.1 dipeptidylpeptidase [Coemansia sp. RSA 2320]